MDIPGITVLCQRIWQTWALLSMMEAEVKQTRVRIRVRLTDMRTTLLVPQVQDYRGRAEAGMGDLAAVPWTGDL